MFFVFYILLVFFGLTHSNILFCLNLLQIIITNDFPLVLLLDTLIICLMKTYYISTEIPKIIFIYIILSLNLLNILITYVLYLFIISNTNFFINIFKSFNYKLLLLFINYLSRFIFLFTSIYDGIRLFLWSIPYLCIIPAIVIYYLIKNIIKVKVIFAILFNVENFIFYIILLQSLLINIHI